MKWIVGDEMGVKASGGIRTFEDAVKMIVYGADRIGTSSGVKIVQEGEERYGG
jgi:deoxyribose-phosphate aldolase